ncbi:FixH family protein [Accumulibacter sp.]|uniref:FixH family protein n=1 Tax=Accumulibacter sp. TaxID=2053492 RepID=UPI0028C4007B|nr:FixH family protein [Accumulibacter sp.]
MKSTHATDSGPWYREPWPWLIMLGPLVVIIAGLATAYLAVISNDGLVADDYYKQGLAINQRTERDQRAAEWGLEAELILGGNNDRIRVLLRANAGTPLPAKLTLRITHPTRPGFDQSVSLLSEGGGVYGAQLVPIHGRWRVVLEDERQEWLLAGDWESEKQLALSLTPSPRAAPAKKKDSANKER